MNLIGKEFRTKLSEFVAKIENESGIEVVVAITPKSGNYTFIPLIAGILVSFIGLGISILTDEELEDEMIFLFSILGFAIGFIIFSFSSISKFFVPKKMLKRNTEIFARAAFQKGHIYETASRQGLLIMISIFEREIFVLEDKVVFARIPFDKLFLLKENFSKVFSTFPDGKASDRLLSALDSMIPICHQYIPKEANDINEIPDDLEIQL